MLGLVPTKDGNPVSAISVTMAGEGLAHANEYGKRANRAPWSDPPALGPISAQKLLDKSI